MTSWFDRTSPFSAPVPLRVRPASRRDAPLLVLCHGMGEDPVEAERRWESVLALDIHVVIPGGPFPFERRTESGIRIGRAWYLYDGSDPLFRETATAARNWLCDTVEAVERDLEWTPCERGLAGYSQGAYFGAYTALTRQDLFSRLIVVAGRIKESFVQDSLTHPGSFHTLILHGADDQQVLPDAATRSRTFLEHAGYPVTLQLLPRGHRLHPDRDAAAAAWLATAWTEHTR